MLFFYSLLHSSYGVSLWYPTYVGKITDQQEQDLLNKKCQTNVTDFDPASFQSYCGCNDSVFQDFTVSNVHIQSWMIGRATFSNVTFSNVTFDNVIIRNHSQFIDSCEFHNCTFNHSKFIKLAWNKVNVSYVQIRSSDVCDLHGVDVTLTPDLIVFNTSINGKYLRRTNIVDSSDILVENINGTNSTCTNSDLSKSMLECRKPDSFALYRDSFFVSASALPGNIASAIAVYFLRRNYWLGKTSTRIYTSASHPSPLPHPPTPPFQVSLSWFVVYC